jgi:Cu-Zn family superoxide dismutase
MTTRPIALLAFLSIPLAAAASGLSGRAVLKGADGKELGTATFTSAEGGVKVHVELTGLTPGKHGIHVHAVAKCEPPEFKSAGGHFNPKGKKHGLESPDGAHAGDMPNLEVGPDGQAKADFVAKGATLGEGEGSLFGGAGTALVVHAGADDQKSDPAGSSGARVACGPIQKD